MPTVDRPRLHGGGRRQQRRQILAQEPAPAGVEHVPNGQRGFAAGGEPALTIRDMLDSGWGGLLREDLPALLAAPPAV